MPTMDATKLGRKSIQAMNFNGAINNTFQVLQGAFMVFVVGVELIESW